MMPQPPVSQEKWEAEGSIVQPVGAQILPSHGVGEPNRNPVVWSCALLPPAVNVATILLCSE